MADDSTQSFIATYGQLANDIAAQTGLDPAVVLGHIAHESGWGQHVSGNNPFGITDGKGHLNSYLDVPGAAQDYVNLMNSDRYKAGISAAKTPQEQIAAIGNGGYGPGPADAANHPNQASGQAYADAIALNAAKVRNLGFGMPPTDSSSPPITTAADGTPMMTITAPAQPPAVAPRSPEEMMGLTTPPPQAAPRSADEMLGLTGSTPSKPATPTAMLNGKPITPGPNGTFSYVGETAPTGNDAYVPVVPGTGRPADATPTIPEAAGAVKDAAVGAYQNSPNLLNPNTQAWLDKTAPAAGYAVHGLNTLLGGVNALYRGGQEALVQAGVPKDIVSIPDAFAGSPHEIASPAGVRAPEAPASAPVPESVTGAEYHRQYYPEPANDTGAANSNGPSPANANANANGPSPGMGAAPDSVGAAATPSAQATMSTREIAAEKLKADQDLLNQPAHERATNGVDTTAYVKGSVPTQAEYDTNTNATQQRADLQKPEFSPQDVARQQANNTARVDHFDQVAGSPVTTLRLEEAREANGDANLQNAWQGRIATNANPVVDTINDIRKSASGKTDPVISAMDNIEAKLHVNNDLTQPLETDPQQLYGARQQINNMLSSNYRKQNPTAADAAPQLQQVMKVLDKQIEEGAPGYNQYRQQWSADSAPIDVERYLQDKRASLFDQNNVIQPSRVQNMMKGIVDDRGARGANPAKLITDDQMSSLWDLRNDLQRRNNIDLGKARGSDTNQVAAASGGLLTRMGQNALDTTKVIGRNALGAGIHLGVNAAGESIAPGLGYALNSGIYANKLVTAQRKIVAQQAAQAATERSALENRVSGYFAEPPGWTP